MPLITGDELHKLFPHRAENILVDKVECPLTPGGTEGSAWLNLARGDKAGRDIFLYEADGKSCLLSPLACEYIALASICVLAPDLQSGDICFFSTISNVKFNGRVGVAAGLTAKVNRQKDRGPFKRFSGAVSGKTGELVSADIMAYALQPDAADASTGGTKRLEIPDTSMNEAVDKAVFAEKSKWMVFVDAITGFNKETLTLTAKHVYPPNHPLTKGHFPGNPVMMGVTQWIAVEDAARLLAKRAGLSGMVTVSGEIIRADGTLVADMKDLVLEMGKGAPVTKSLSRIGFRGMVKPGEEIFVRVTTKKD